MLVCWYNPIHVKTTAAFSSMHTTEIVIAEPRASAIWRPVAEHGPEEVDLAAAAMSAQIVPWERR